MGSEMSNIACTNTQAIIGNLSIATKVSINLIEQLEHCVSNVLPVLFLLQPHKMAGLNLLSSRYPNDDNTENN
jgi:hypothetical protein